MKNQPTGTNRPSAAEDEEAPTPLEELVEDLAQQDVLPADNGSIEIPEESIAGGLDEAGRWDEPIGDRGHRAHQEPLDDEASYPEQLVSGGLAEADEELRELDEDSDSLEDDLL